MIFEIAMSIHRSIGITGMYEDYWGWADEKIKKKLSSSNSNLWNYWGPPGFLEPLRLPIK